VVVEDEDEACSDVGREEFVVLGKRADEVVVDVPAAVEVACPAVLWCAWSSPMKPPGEEEDDSPLLPCSVTTSR